MYTGFKKLKENLASTGAKNPGALAASIGMKKYGKKKFERASHTGKPIPKSERK